MRLFKLRAGRFDYIPARVTEHIINLEAQISARLI
jgi:hypothetical protein